MNVNAYVFATNKIQLLEHTISDGELKSDADRVRPLLELPVPSNNKELQRVVEMFSYYAQWMPHFSEKLKPLVGIGKFPLTDDAIDASPPKVLIPTNRSIKKLF